MKDLPRNHYEVAFENWLIDNHIQYIAIDERKKAAFARGKVKSFDFLLYPRNGQVIIVEVKGRKFKGTTLSKLTGLECWVTTEDIDGLTKWQEIFGPGHQAIFVFTYNVENIDVDFDGREAYDFAQKRYIFLGVKLDDYRSFMKVRSPKWQTVTLPAEKFRRCVMQIRALFLTGLALK
jgi:hypothetical protein